jgi:hypothetical protein
MLANGEIGELHRSMVLGTVADLPTRREAQAKFEEHLRPINQGTGRPESVMAFGNFVETQSCSETARADRYGSRRC